MRKGTLKTARDMNDDGAPKGAKLVVLCRGNQTVTMRLHAPLATESYAYN